MGDSPFQLAVAAVLRPLEFAAQDDFARLGRIRDLESSIAGAAQRVCALAVPPDAKNVFAHVAKSFSSRSKKDLVERVRDALERVRPLAGSAWSEAQLARSPAILPGLGPKRAETLARRGLRTVGDLLFYLPARYDDRRTLQSVDGLEVGRRATFVARVLGCTLANLTGRFLSTLNPRCSAGALLFLRFFTLPCLTN